MVKARTVGNLSISTTPEVKELKRSVERLQALIDEAPIGICHTDLTGKFTYVNKRFEEVSGYSREEVAGKSGFKLGMFSNETVELLGKRMKDILVGKPPRLLETQFKCKDGHWLWVAMEGKLMRKQGMPIGFQLISNDITERRQVEEELLRLSNAVKMSTDSIVISDLEAKIIEINEATLKMYGADDKKDLIGENSLELIAPEEREKALEAMREVLQKGYVKEREYHIITKDGSKVFVEMNVALMKDVTGKPIGFVAISRDITERKRMEEALKAAQEQLIRSEKLAAIGQLAGGVGHELRNPLSAIKNAVYYIKGKVADSELGQKEPRVLEFLGIIKDEVNSSNKIINDLLEFSRVRKPTVSPAKIEKIIEDALSRTPIPQSIKLTRKLDASLPEINVDPDQIKQVVVNIITNAVQAMPEGGRLLIGAREKDKFLEVEVTDTGCGIPQEAVDKIFDPLFTTKAKGIGLGLAVCKSIIDRHEGNIAVKSKVGEGTTFNIKLPLGRGIGGN
jgi:PAS domain S-box-containing protein